MSKYFKNFVVIFFKVMHKNVGIKNQTEEMNFNLGKFYFFIN